MRQSSCILFSCLLLVLSGCSTKKNTFFTRQYHQLTTRYNVYFNGNEALKGGMEKMERNHREDYTNLLPVFVSNDEQTRALCQSDMTYAIEKAAKAIDEHSITVKPKRRKNKDSKSYETFRKKKEFNDQIAKCYLLLGKGYFYNRKYTMANNTFRYIQRQYPEEEKLLTEVQLWLFRSLTEQERYEEAAALIPAIESAKLKRAQREMYAASKTDFYIRRQQYGAAIPAAEELIRACTSLKRKPRYQFLLSQLYLKEGRDGEAGDALKKAIRFNFDYEMVFNARINMALAYRGGEDGVKKQLNKMLKDAKNADFQDRIYYALATIEEKEGKQQEAVAYYWKSVRNSVDNDNQKSLSFLKLGDYYYGRREYVPAQSCYDSCLYFMDSRIDGYDVLKERVTDLTELVVNLNIIQKQDSLQRVAALPEAERKALIDGIIQKVKEEEEQAKEAERLAIQERSFFMRNDMLGQGNSYTSQNSGGEGDWYFYNPVTISLGENEFKRKWGRRKLEDNWRRQNKSMVDPEGTDLLAVEGGEKEGEITDTKSPAYYLQDVPLTEEEMAASRKMVETAYYNAGEIYLYQFNDPEKALACFAEFIRRYPESANIVSAYYLAYESAGQAGNATLAGQYKEELLRKYPDSDLAKGLQDPAYFSKMDSDLEAVNRIYEEAYRYYRNDYYPRALELCDEILRKYPENKLLSNVLLLRAMCILNLRPESEARAALQEVAASKPNREITEVVNGILAAMDVGEQPVLYTDANMEDSRSLRSSRNWRFDREEPAEETAEKEQPYQLNKEQEHYVVLVLPDSLKMTQNLQIQGRLTFINAGEQVATGSKYEIKKEAWWYKTNALEIGVFKDAESAVNYANRVGTDKTLLRNFRGETYRLFAIGKENLPVLKRRRDIEGYVDFFIENYFTDKAQGEIVSGRQGATAHLFNFDANERHDLAIVLPFRRINTNRVAETLRALDPAFALSRERYDNDHEMVVVKNIGAQGPAMDYLDSVSKDKKLFELLKDVQYRLFVITPENRTILQENRNLEEYMRFFSANYLTNRSAEVGVEDGGFVYKTNLPHKFVLCYSNEIDPFRLKAAFEKFNTAGLTLNNYKYDDSRDLLTVSGFADKEEAMRYFYAAVNDRSLFRDLRSTDYRNFVITESNLEVLRVKKEVESYLLFFRKYYLDNGMQ